MAGNGTNQPLLPGLLDPTSQTNNKTAPKKRRYRRCKSAPLADFVLPDINGKDALQYSESLFGKFHPNIKKIIKYVSAYLSAGTMCFYLIRNQLEGKKTNGILDALYFCVVTMTTVGYGDLVPISVPSKLLACGFVFSGMGIVGVSMSKAADYLVEKQEIFLIKALHMRQKLGPTELLKEVETNDVRYKSFLVSALLFLLMLVGTVFLALVEKLSFVDAFYCVCSTITTLGYGDKSFSTLGGRIFAVFWILGGTISLARFFFYMAELNAEKRQKALANWVLTRRMTIGDLERADIDNDGVVDAAEFIIYKLKEMGKITQEDISLVLDEFENLDIDQSGTLSVSDIALAQSIQTKGVIYPIKK